MNVWGKRALYSLTTWSAIQLTLFIWLYSNRAWRSRHGPWIPKALNVPSERVLAGVLGVMWASLLVGFAFSAVGVVKTPRDRRSWSALAIAAVIIGLYVYQSLTAKLY